MSEGVMRADEEIRAGAERLAKLTRYRVRVRLDGAPEGAKDKLLNRLRQPCCDDTVCCSLPEMYWDRYTLEEAKRLAEVILQILAEMPARFDATCSVNHNGLRVLEPLRPLLSYSLDIPTEEQDGEQG